MIRIPRRGFALLAGAALIVTPAAALAQNDVTEQAQEVAEQAEELQAATNTLTQEVADQRAADTAANAGADGDGDRRDRDDDDDSGKWGWLGLLGLAGLLGLRRRDDHVHHDHRRDHDRSTTSGTTTGSATRSGTGSDSTRL